MTRNDRRSAVRAVLAAALLSLSAWAQALTIQPYSEAALQQLQAAGAAVGVHFHADWCPTCRKQAESLKQLKDDPQLRPVTVLVANYDTEQALRRALKVRSQSTLVIYKGRQEVARLLGQTSVADISAALAKAL